MLVWFCSLFGLKKGRRLDFKGFKKGKGIQRRLDALGSAIESSRPRTAGAGQQSWFPGILRGQEGADSHRQ